MNLIIMGPPGAGKGTQSEFLVRHYHLLHLSTGDLLRAEIQQKTELGLKAQSYSDQGKYVPDDLMNQVVASKLTKIKTNFILDGYPRTSDQVKFLETVLKKIKQKIDFVIYLEVSKEAVIKRLQTRLICPVCKTTYNTISSPPKVDNLCDNDQTPLIQRTDDSDQAKIITRLKTYQQSTQPLVAYFKKQGNLKLIDANQDQASVHEQLKKVIGTPKGTNND
ncbi:adenylate kinase [Spiroplasma sp. JKS002671]|uniref:adenylate kinase n=1 Tax=Spiroplasma attinicola TaxID=2904537 RepID=UPI0020229C2D|nr:adenylate kinase [Spiroplasma sp. JKS002671]MCL8210567.1 adenylate kinase [Spiroplasma sp. JKS002671]